MRKGDTFLFAGGGYNADVYTVNFGARSFAYTRPNWLQSTMHKRTSRPRRLPMVRRRLMRRFIQVMDPRKQLLAFNPDLGWIKTRNDSISHYLGNTVVGINKNLESNNTQAESTNNVYGYVSATTSDGFTVTAGSGSSILVNGSKNYVGWAWDAGSSTVSNTDGTITSTQSKSNCWVLNY